MRVDDVRRRDAQLVDPTQNAAAALAAVADVEAIVLRVAGEVNQPVLLALGEQLVRLLPGDGPAVAGVVEDARQGGDGQTDLERPVTWMVHQVVLLLADAFVHQEGLAVLDQGRNLLVWQSLLFRRDLLFDRERLHHLRSLREELRAERLVVLLRHLGQLSIHVRNLVLEDPEHPGHHLEEPGPSELDAEELTPFPHGNQLLFQTLERTTGAFSDLFRGFEGQPKVAEQLCLIGLEDLLE